MGADAVIAIIGAVLTIISIVVTMMTNKKANRTDLGKAEADELLEGMSKVDAIYAATSAPPPAPPGGVRPPGQ